MGGGFYKVFDAGFGSVHGNILHDLAKDHDCGYLPFCKKLACILVFGGLIASMLISGVMTIAREYVSADHFGKTDEGTYEYIENGYEVVSKELVDVTEWIKENTAPDATFLTATNHNNAIAMLTGRNIVCGSSSFLYYHGVNYQERHENVKRIYESPVEYYSRFVDEYGFDYVLVSPWEMGEYSVDSNFFHSLTPVFTSGRTTLYKAR